MPDSWDTMDARARDAWVAERVIELDVRGECLACYHDEGGWNVDFGGLWDDSTMQPVYLASPHWDVAKGYEPDPDEILVNGASKYGLCVVDFFTTDPTADYAVLCRVRDTFNHQNQIAFDEALTRPWCFKNGRRKWSLVLGGAMRYEPGDYSRAAYEVLTKHESETRDV